MKDFWTLEPEVGGELGPNSSIDSNFHPPRVSKLQYLFNGWLGDELLESFPCYIVTKRVADALVGENFSGFQLDSLQVKISEEFNELYPERQLPEFKWLKISGEAGTDDFGISSEHLLVVSDPVLKCLNKFSLDQCDIEKF